VIRRVLLLFVLLIVVSFLTFSIFFAVPKFTGQSTAVLFAGKSPTPAAVADVEKKLGLDKPFFVQYGSFMKGIVVGRDFVSGSGTEHCPAPCFGYSFVNDRPVWTELKEAMPVTFSLAIGAAILWLITGVGVGIISALKKRSWFDRLSMGIALAGVSLPIYFTGLVMLKLFSYQWHIFNNVHYAPFLDNPISWASNLILPWVALAFLYAALYARLTRSGMLETMGEDYIRTARAKGLKESRVIGRHGLRAALTPIVTIFGLDVGGLLGGAILTEYTFGFPGIGKMSVDGVFRRDLPVILGVTLFAAFFILLANLIVDLLYAVVDPRVRYT
jgi:peptide/nickel transport system permease protein